MESANTHPSMGPLFVGLVSRMEKDRPPGDLRSYRRRIMTTLAAHGDRIFWGNLKPFAATLGVLTMLCFPVALVGSFLALLIYDVPNFYIRIRGFRWGFEEGLKVLEKFRSTRMEALLGYVRLASSLALGLLSGLVLWQCYQNQFEKFGNFYGLVSALDVSLAGLIGFALVRSGFSVSKVTLPVVLAAILVFGIFRYWIGIP